MTRKEHYGNFAPIGETMNTIFAKAPLKKAAKLMIMSETDSEGVGCIVNGTEILMELHPNITLFYDEQTHEKGLIVKDTRVTVDAQGWNTIAEAQCRLYMRVLKHAGELDPFRVDKAMSYIQSQSGDSIASLVALLGSVEKLPTQLVLLAHLTRISTQKAVVSLGSVGKLELLYDLRELIPPELLKELRKDAK